MNNNNDWEVVYVNDKINLDLMASDTESENDSENENDNMNNNYAVSKENTNQESGENQESIENRESIENQEQRLSRLEEKINNLCDCISKSHRNMDRKMKNLSK